MPRIGSRFSGAGAADPPPPRTSASVIPPCGPVPAIVARSTPSSCAPRRTSGGARTFAPTERVVAEHGVHALRHVDDLRHAEVDGDACQRERMLPSEAELALHQVEHRRHALLRCEIEILVEAECKPGAVDPRDRRPELEVA